MELTSVMPIIHFKPVEKKRSAKGTYSTPLYMYPVRSGSPERPSYILNVDLKSGTKDINHWIKRGAVMLLSLRWKRISFDIL